MGSRRKKRECRSTEWSKERRKGICVWVQGVRKRKFEHVERMGESS